MRFGMRPGSNAALWVAVFAGPALRTALLGGLLVSEAAIGKAFGLSAGALAILVECSIFGGLLAVILLPVLTRRFATRLLGVAASFGTIVFLAAGISVAPHLSPGAAATTVLYAGALLLGFFVALLSPIAQVMLNSTTEDNPQARHTLQSAWSAGLPAGFIAASLIGGVLVEAVGWWTALAVPLALALVAGVALLGTGYEDRHDTDEIRASPQEIAILVMALVAFEIWSTWGSLASWLDPGVNLALLATIAAGAFAVAQLRKSPKPAISVEPFAVTGFAAATLIMLLYQLPTTAEFEVLLLTELNKIAPEVIGDRTAIGNAGQVAGTVIAGWLLLRKQVRLALVAGFALSLAGLAAYTLYPWVDGFAYIAATRTITGLGGGLLTPVLFVIALDRMPVAMQLAAGTWLVLANIGGVEIGLAVFDAVLEVTQTVTGSRLTAYLTVEIAQFVFCAALALVAAYFAMTGRLITEIGAKPARDN